jgi:hypothetical protein
LVVPTAWGGWGRSTKPTEQLVTQLKNLLNSNFGP